MVYCGRLLNVGSRSWIYVVLYGIYSLGWRVKNSKDKEKGMSEEVNNKLGALKKAIDLAEKLKN